MEGGSTIVLGRSTIVLGTREIRKTRYLAIFKIEGNGHLPDVPGTGMACFILRPHIVGSRRLGILKI